MQTKRLNFRTGDPELMREINQALILNLLRNNNKLSRAQISRKLDISKPTVSRVVEELIEEKVIKEIGVGESKEAGGRRPVMLSINSSGRYVLGADIGTTNTAVAIANLKGKILNKIRVPTSRDHNVKTIVSQVSNLVNQIVKETNVDRKSIAGLGIAEAGIVDKDSGIIKFSPNFNWKNVNIVKLLENKTDLKILADNCTRAMALGEKFHGKNKGIKNMLYINIGYGIGSALVINGKIYNNNSEFGHIPITDKKILCGCGKYGCLEAVASGNAIESKANQIYSNNDKDWITAKDVALKAEQGDEKAQEIFYDTGCYIGKGISFIANVFNPDKIILGGGVSLAGDLLLEPVIKSFKKCTMDIIKQNTKIEISSLGMDAGIYGAITMVLNQMIFYTYLI